MLEHLTNEALIDQILNHPAATEQEKELVERLQAAIEEIERLTHQLARQEVPVGADA